MEIKTFKDENGQEMVALIASETERVCMNLSEIRMICAQLRDPMEKRGMRYKVEAIERLVDDMVNRITPNENA